MPKVEILLTPRGQSTNMKTTSLHYISNIAKNIQGLDVDLIISYIENSSLRKKRDVSSIKYEPVVKTRKKIIKKLVRVQPKNMIVTSPSTEASNNEFTTRRARRRLKVKKKRLLTQLNKSTKAGDYLQAFNAASIESEDDLQQATKPRRKIIITRKRLLPRKEKSLYNNVENLTIKPSPIMSQVEHTSTSLNKQINIKQNYLDATAENLIENNLDDHNTQEIITENIIESNDSEEDKDIYGNHNTTTEALKNVQTLEKTNGTNFLENEDVLEKSKMSDESEEEKEDFTGEHQVTDEYDNYANTNLPTFQSIPEYEPFFPELTESLDAPVLLLKTTVLSSIELLTKTTVQSRLRTYTFIVTRVHGTEKIVTSTTEVKPQIKTTVLTEPFTKYTTLTLLDFDATETLTELQKTTIPNLDKSPPQLLNQENPGRGYEEARYNIATRVMSNGVEVIVAGDRTTLPGEPDVRREAPSNVQKPVTLKPSTVTDHMVMMMPQESAKLNDLATSLYPNQFVTKTCLTTFTYLTTYLEGSTTTVSSHEQVVANIATEERNTGKILPTPAMGVTLTEYPNLSVGVFHTTYTYLNTILDGEQPLVVSSKHTVTNTVTAPDDYLSLLQPSYIMTAIKDTNTYYSTIDLTKTLYEGDKSSVVSTKEVITQVVITESVPPRATSVMTSYIALDLEGHSSPLMSSYTTTDVIKTYFVTYTYFNTIMENGKPVINTNISTSSDIITEKLFLYPKKTNSLKTITSTTSKDEKKHKHDLSDENFYILATKTYFTTFTYFTTMLQEHNSDSPTVISSRTRVVENLVTETINPNLLDKKYLSILKNDVNKVSSRLTKVATLRDGQKIEITVIANDSQETIIPTKVLSIEKTEDPGTTFKNTESSVKHSSSSTSNIITGSTIVFVDDDPFAQFASTPSLDNKSKASTLKNNLGSLLSSEIVKNTKISTAFGKTKRSTKTKLKPPTVSISPTKTKPPGIQTEPGEKKKGQNQNLANINKSKPQNNKNKHAVGTKISKQPVAADLLGLGSINIQALTPVLNAMAGLINSNLKSNKRTDTNETATTIPTIPKLDSKKEISIIEPVVDVQNRSPIYIPVGGLAEDFEIAESQNIATFDWIDPPHQHNQLPGKTTHEAPLLNGGIPISPGEVITANSDVIVGKPGRIGPRIPTIPLNQIKTENDVPIGMKPPPIPNKILTNHNEYKQIPLANIRYDKPSTMIKNASNVDYVGLPPPSGKENLGDDKRKHIPLTPPRKGAQSYYDAAYLIHNTRYENNEIPLKHHEVAINHNAYRVENYGPIHASNEINHVINLPNLQHTIQQNYKSVTNNINPTFSQDHAILAPDSQINIKPPSVINEPIVLPEVIERSTGQPLLVNIQPSQVAFVNIPFNRTTALIYGGSTEPHKNGQYFDDPSPYPDPEFSGTEFNNGIPQAASVYHHDEPANQKQVKGVMKVGNQLINIEPGSGDQTIKFDIKPSKPLPDTQLAYGNDHEISINVPPISFGLIHQDNDVNAHIINHGDIDFRPPATSYQITMGQPSEGNTGYLEFSQGFNKNDIQKPFNDGIPLNQNDRRQPSRYANHAEDQQLIKEIRPTFPQPPRISDTKRPTHQQNPQMQTLENLHIVQSSDIKKYFPPKRNNLHPWRRPSLEISEYMTPPPPVNKNTLSKHVYNRQPSKRPLSIPLAPNEASAQRYNAFNQPYSINYIPSIDPDIGDHKQDDLENEEGEVIQESNSRPLLPGEVPIEILKAEGSTTERSNINNNNTIRFPAGNKFILNDFRNNKRPTVSQNARPFVTSQLDTKIRPENKFVRLQVPISNTQNSVVQPENQQISEIVSVKDGMHLQIKQPSGFTNTQSTRSQNPTTKHKNSPSNFVVVGSQFEDGNQFTNVFSQVENDSSINNLNTANKNPMESYGSSTPNYPLYIENTLDTAFGFNTRNPVTINKITKGTTHKPIIIYFDDAIENKENFFNRRNKNTNRLSVTSLPIDTYTNEADDSGLHSTLPSSQINTQTEKAFIFQNNPSQLSNEMNIINNTNTSEEAASSFVQKVTPDLNTGEVTAIYSNVSTELSDMEIMKPPPLIANLPVKKLNVEYTKIEVDNHGDDILRVPSIQTDSESKNPSNHEPYMPKPPEILVPPTETTTDEEVLGMIPPPLVSTHKPSISNKPITTTKPVFSMEIHIPKKVPVFKPSSTTSTERYNRFTIPRRPYIRRPGLSKPTTTLTTTEISIKNKRPTYPVYNIIDRGTTSSTTTKKIISPSPTVKSKPSLEIIIGHPNLNTIEKQTSTTTESNEANETMEITGSEVPLREAVTHTTISLNQNTTDLQSVESAISTSNYNIQSSEPIPKNELATHHAGNEIKIVDETVEFPNTTTTKKVITTFTTDNKPVIPTRYITYTKTTTVTITKTTVIKTLGGPPSTLTILLTTTQTSTIVDTVTEFHTLVKPTSIIATVTTTVHHGSSLYPPDVYGSPYPSIQIKPSLVTSIAQDMATPISNGFENDLNEFIISETDPPINTNDKDEVSNNDSILVVMTDKNTKTVVKVPNSSFETPDRDETVSNKVNNILLAGVLSANQPTQDVFERKTGKCEPDCKATRNELCQKVEGILRCICRPGFARMFPDRPCLPTYTYSVKITLDRIGRDQLHYFDDLGKSNSTEFIKFGQATRESLDRMVMQSDVRDIFHGVHVHSFGPSPTTKGIVTSFYLQLSDNIDEVRLEDIFKKYLRNNNYSLGGTDIFASPQSIEELKAQDFDECSHTTFHDCSENAQCFNLRGTYTCSCREGYSDLSENMLYPGRICSADQIGCERCNYHGTCFSRGGDDILCECFQWYAGESCHINLKVLLIALVTLGAILFILLLVCLILTCVNRKPRKVGVTAGMSFFPQRIGSSVNRSTLDRRAMIQDTSSEDSRSETNTLPYVQKKQKIPKGALKRNSKVSVQPSNDVKTGETSTSFSDQKDRSLTVMIPRAKYHPAPPTSPLMNYTTFDARKPSAPSVSEAKLLSYLDAGPSSNKVEVKRKCSNNPSEMLIEEPNSRKTSGALVSAGFEVSATVSNNMGTLGTTCGTEADRSENATLIQKISADLLSSTGTRSQFNTLRKSLVDDDLESSTNWLDIVPRVTTVSEARSYDDTTIPPPMKSFRTNYNAKPSSQQPNDEANTMAERDLGSTFLLPHTHLYKPDRGSDISGFESL